MFKKRLIKTFLCSLVGLILLAFGVSKAIADADIVISVFSPGRATIEQDLNRKIKVKVANVGDVTTGSFSVDIILSTDTTAPIEFATYDPYFSEDVLLLGGREFIENLRPGQVKYVRLNGSNRIPLDTPTGILYIGVVADPGESVTEETEDNNVDFTPIRIRQQP